MAFGDLVKSNTDSPTTQSVTSCDLGSNPTSGNLLIFVAYGGSGGTSVTTPPSGFTQMHENTTNFNLTTYYKVSDGTEQTAGHTHGNSNSVGATYAEYDMGGNTSPSVLTDSTAVSGTETSKNAGSVTPTETTNFTAAFASVDSLGNIAATESWNSSYTLDLNMTTNGAVAAFGSRTNTVGAQSPTYSHGGTADQMYGAIAAFSFSAGGGSASDAGYYYQANQ